MTRNRQSSVDARLPGIIPQRVKFSPFILSHPFFLSLRFVHTLPSIFPMKPMDRLTNIWGKTLVPIFYYAIINSDVKKKKKGEEKNRFEAIKNFQSTSNI